MSIREPGVCPICGQADLDYGRGTSDGEAYTYECWCTKCGFDGKEIYALEFLGHTEKGKPGIFIE